MARLERPWFVCKLFYCQFNQSEPIGSNRLCSATAIPFIYSFSGNCAASAPISTFMCLWAIYIFPGSAHIFTPAEKADPSWEYTIRSLTHECGNWDWGPDIPFLGIFASNFRHFFFAVWYPCLVLFFSRKPPTSEASGLWGPRCISARHSSISYRLSPRNHRRLTEALCSRAGDKLLKD